MLANQILKKCIKRAIKWSENILVVLYIILHIHKIQPDSFIFGNYKIKIMLIWTKIVHTAESEINHGDDLSNVAILRDPRHHR